MKATGVLTAVAIAVLFAVWRTSGGSADWAVKLPAAGFPVVYAAVFSVMLAEVRNDFSGELVRAVGWPRRRDLCVVGGGVATCRCVFCTGCWCRYCHSDPSFVALPRV